MSEYQYIYPQHDMQSICVPYTRGNIPGHYSNNQSLLQQRNLSQDLVGLDGTQQSPNLSLFADIENLLYSRIIVVICIFGILGNVVNLIVLTRQRMHHRLDRMEMSAHMGLVALAVSDMLFCATIIPHAWVPKHVFYFQVKGFSLYYTLYGEAFINTFTLCSTWLTVVMAMSRYVAICHPLHARSVIGCRFVKICVTLVFLLSSGFNIPRFWYEEVDHMDCVGGWRVYFRSPGYLKNNLWLDTAYLYFYLSFSTVLPVILLLFCNIHLIRALKQSNQLRRRFSLDITITESTQRITLTLVIIILMNIFLVAPAEIINFMRNLAISNQSMIPAYNLAVVIVNTLVSVNFSFNFFLYCTVNVQFRRTLQSWFCRKEATRNVLLNYGSLSTATHLHTKNDSRKCSAV